MKEIQLKIGRDLIWVNEKDLILDNGSCIQILTRKHCKGHPIKISKKLFKEFKTCYFVCVDNTIKSEYPEMVYYKFNIKQMLKSAAYPEKEE